MELLNKLEKEREVSQALFAQVYELRTQLGDREAKLTQVCTEIVTQNNQLVQAQI
jgi:hypothetical protein